jgi:acetyl esterase
MEELGGLPPATIITAEADVVRDKVVRDKGEAYASKLREAGVQVTAVRYLGTIHDFILLDALRDTGAARAAIAQTANTLRTAFARETERISD